MEKRPAVSVIIPVYNTEAYLAECLDSVANQTLRDIEIICVDDGSTDDSLRILASCAKSDERIRIFSKCNGGISSARNLGLDYARGEYVFFLDSDDMLSVQALQELTQIAERRRTDILYSDSAPFFETAELEDRYHDWIARGRRSQEYCGVVTGGELFAEMSRHDDYRAPSTRALYRRAYLVEKGLRFYEGIVHEDELFTLISMLEASAVSHVRKAYYQRRVRGDSVMTSGLTYRSFQGYFIVYAELMRYALSHTFEERIQSRLWNRIMTIRKNAFAKYDSIAQRRAKRHYMDKRSVCAGPVQDERACSAAEKNEGTGIGPKRIGAYEAGPGNPAVAEDQGRSEVPEGKRRGVYLPENLSKGETARRPEVKRQGGICGDRKRDALHGE